METNTNAVTEEPKVIIVYRTHTPAQKKAQQKYYEADKQKIIDKNVNYYRGKKDTEEYKKNKAIYNKTYTAKEIIETTATTTTTTRETTTRRETTRR